MNDLRSYSPMATPSHSCPPLWDQKYETSICHALLHAAVDLPKKAVQKADFSPSPAQRCTTDLFFPHSHVKWQERSDFSAEGQPHQPCPFPTCVRVHTHPSAHQNHAQPTGLQEHTLAGILMSWTCAELPSLAAILVICWLSKAHSGLFF